MCNVANRISQPYSLSRCYRSPPKQEVRPLFLDAWKLADCRSLIGWLSLPFWAVMDNGGWNPGGGVVAWDCDGEEMTSVSSGVDVRLGGLVYMADMAVGAVELHSYCRNTFTTFAENNSCLTTISRFTFPDHHVYSSSSYIFLYYTKKYTFPTKWTNQR
jgi:hypothetical protein